eukprot:PRCOL_00004852-RA
MALLADARGRANRRLAGYDAATAAVIGAAAALGARWALATLAEAEKSVRAKGLKMASTEAAIALAMAVPGVAAFKAREQAKVLAKMHKDKPPREDALFELPAGRSAGEVASALGAMKDMDAAWQARTSGTVYMGSEGMAEHEELVGKAVTQFLHSNPLHGDLFPSAQRCEAEVVAMCASLLHGDVRTTGVVGNMTSGGTESILMAVKSARDYARQTRGITDPELVMCENAHPAYDKAASYFGLRVVRTRARPGALDADPAAMRRGCSRNTVLLIASAPSYPHGVVDDVTEIAATAKSLGACCHVDCCLGGFVVPFAKAAGVDLPPFDFAVPGVTSISIDTHKYGLAPKGSSVVLYRSKELRRCMFSAATEWTGGLYVSPSVAGSRVGSLVVGAWAALVHVGADGYASNAKKILDAAKQMAQGIAKIDGLEIVGRPDAMVVAFGSVDQKALDIFKVNDALADKGWSLNPLQKPSALHFCLTMQHVDGAVDDFLRDLAECVAYVRANPSWDGSGMAPIYGMATAMPDRGAIADLLTYYMDSSTDV